MTFLDSLITLPPLGQIRQLNFHILTAYPYLRLSLTRNRRYPLFWKNSRRLSKPYQIIFHSNGVRLNSYLADSANIAFSTKAAVWCTKPFLDWLPWSWPPKESHLISSSIDKSNIPATSWCSHECLSNFSQQSSYTILLKRGYRHLHGAVREYMINLKERPQVSMSHLDQLLMTLCSFYELVPDSTITNTTSYENLDVTAHPLFLIVNWTSPFTIVCYEW